MSGAPLQQQTVKQLRPLDGEASKVKADVLLFTDEPVVGQVLQCIDAVTGRVRYAYPAIGGSVVTLSADATISPGTGFALVATGGSDKIITLDLLDSTPGLVLVKKTDLAAGRVVLTPASGLIENLTTWELTIQGDAAFIFNDGTNYYLMP